MRYLQARAVACYRHRWREGGAMVNHVQTIAAVLGI